MCREHEGKSWVRGVATGLCFVCGAMIFGDQVCPHDGSEPCPYEERPHPEVTTGRETQNRMPVVLQSGLIFSLATSTGINMHIPPSGSDWTIATRG